MSIDYKVIGAKIREERKKKGFTQEQLAHQINISTAYMGQIERGERNSSLDIIVDIANALEITVDYILESSYAENSRYNEAMLTYNIIKMLQNRDSRDVQTAFSMLTTLFDSLETYKRRPWSNESFSSQNETGK